MEMLCEGCRTDGEFIIVDVWEEDGRKLMLVMCEGCGEESVVVLK